jgi:60 kDa SS-A/Ro ribonucleoprotein
MDPLTTISTRTTPQNQRATGPDGERQIPNTAGGYGFAVTDEVRVRRFLTLGVDGGTYYASQKALTKANAEVVLTCAQTRAEWLVGEIVTISTAGRAPRQNPAIFALAAVSALGDDAGRKAALAALPQVCRTGTHLFVFAGYVEQFRGWGRGLRRAIGEWYTEKTVDQVAYQAVKYRQREGWSHRDLLRLAHPQAEGARAGLFDWIVRGGGSDIPLIEAFTQAQAATDVATWVRLIGEHPLSWEMLPDAALGEAAVWQALIDRGMPQTALMRQLPRLTRLGVLASGSPTLAAVVRQLTDATLLQKSRLHPVNVLVAQRTYASGQSARGTGEWTPVRQIVDALDAAFYAAFTTIEPSGKRTLLALDVSGSMTSPAGGLPISCREATAALALVTMATEDDVTCVGFTSTGSGYGGRWGGGSAALTELALSPRQRLDDAIASISDLPFGGTDCSLPFTWALEQNREYDTVVVMTDNETWAGGIHPHQALRRYRERTGINTRTIVVGMTASDVSIADPKDPGSLDIAGFDSAVPNLIADFSRGAL